MFGAKIKFMRIRKGITQVDLAERIGISQATITQWETDRSSPMHENIVKLARIFKCSIDELYDYECAAADVWEDYIHLDPSQRELIQQLIKTMRRVHEENEEARE